MLPDDPSHNSLSTTTVTPSTPLGGGAILQDKINQEIYKQNFELSIRNKTLSTLKTLYAITTSSAGLFESAQKIVDSIVEELKVTSARISMVDEKENVLRTIAMNQSAEMLKAVEILGRPLSELVVPMENKNNLSVSAILENQKKVTGNMLDVLTPQATQEKADEIAQITGIKTILIFPLTLAQKTLGVLNIGMAKREADLSRADHETLEQIIDVVAIALDRARLLDDLQNANDRLHELDKLKSEFVSVASHELRTPMTAIKSYLWMALAGKGGSINDKQKYYLERAYISTDRLIKLVNDLLNVSRIESGKLSLEATKLDLSQFIDEVISEVKPRADETGVMITNEYDSSHPLPPVLGDSDKLKEVVINLIGNSLKFTNQGGKIRVWFEIKDNMAWIHVTDDGEGISPEDLPKLFQKFGLVKESYVTNQKASQGTGLGLYISKSIVELHHGKMWAESEGHGKGATFTFTLPIYTDALLAQFNAEYQKKEGLGIIHSTID